jgi:hypothetical protein
MKTKILQKIFARNLTPNFRLYIRERLKMALPWHAGALAKAAITRSQRRSKQRKEIRL